MPVNVTLEDQEYLDTLAALDHARDDWGPNGDGKRAETLLDRLKRLKPDNGIAALPADKAPPLELLRRLAHVVSVIFHKQKGPCGFCGSEEGMLCPRFGTESCFAHDTLNALMNMKVPPMPTFHFVLHGDTLSGIAVKYGWRSGMMGADAIQRANRLADSVIQPGWVLIIPNEVR